MKIFLSKLLTREYILLLTVIVLAFVVRFYNFSNRVNFGSEQARSLVTSAGYIHDKPSLLGQEYFRVASNGHKIFSGALFNYMLVPLMLVSNYNPVIITVFFTFLNIITGFIVYLVAKKLFDSKVAIFSSIIFLFNDVMIYHSFFIWNYNILPIIGITTLYYLATRNNKLKTKYVFILGTLSGIGTSLQLLYVLPTLLIFGFAVWKSKNRLIDSLTFIGGIILGNLPMALFDIRHNFYNLTTLWQYTIDTFRGMSDASFSYYYLLPFWPVIALLVGWILAKVGKFSRLLSIFLISVYLFVNLTSSKVSFSKAIGMPDGLITSDIEYTAKIIAQDVDDNFNVVEDLDFDKRAYVLRYFLQYKFDKKPMEETEYTNPPVVYALVEKGYNFEDSHTWEINAGGPYKIILLSDIGNGYGLYKLTK